MKVYMCLGAAVAALTSSCATPAPTQRLEASSAAIRAAEEVGANEQPTAALHLQLAKEQTERAKKMIVDGDKEGAGLLLARAEADANLSVALARTAQEQADARGAIAKVVELKNTQN